MDEKRIREIIRGELAASSNLSRFRVNTIPQHVHNGTDSPKINQSNVIPGIRTVGRIFFARTAQYVINTPFNPTSVRFNGVAYDSAAYTFTLAEVVTNATQGAIYTNNGEYFTVTTTIGSGDTTLIASGTGDPDSSGSLVKVFGDGESVIDYSSYSAPGTPTIRSYGTGEALLGPSYYMQPESTNTVKTGGPLQSVVQLGSSTTTGASGTRLIVTETNLWRVSYPTNAVSDYKVTLQIPRFTPNGIYIDCTLADGWSVYGNYIVT